MSVLLILGVAEECTDLSFSFNPSFLMFAGFFFGELVLGISFKLLLSFFEAIFFFGISDQLPASAPDL